MTGTAEAFAAAALGNIGHLQVGARNKLICKVRYIFTDIVTGVITGQRVLHSCAKVAFFRRAAYRVTGGFLQRHHAAFQLAFVAYLKVEDGPASIGASGIPQLGRKLYALISLLQTFLSSRAAFLVDCPLKRGRYIR